LILEILWSISEFVWALVVGVIDLVLYCSFGSVQCYNIYDGAVILMITSIAKLIFQYPTFCCLDYMSSRIWMKVYLCLQGLWFILTIVAIAIFPENLIILTGIWPCLIVEILLSILLVVGVVRYHRAFGWTTPITGLTSGQA